MNSEAIRPNPRKTESVRKLGKVDYAQLRDAVLTIPESVWNAEDASKPNRFAERAATRHIVFRFVSDLRDWRESYDGPLWEQFRPLIEPVIMAAVRPYGYARGVSPRVMLARMAPGGTISPHRDQNPAAKWPHKIHVPLQTSDQVTFWIDGKAYFLPEGEAVEVNNMAIHAVENRGSMDRIHLIFEYYDAEQPEPPWLHQLLTVSR